MNSRNIITPLPHPMFEVKNYKRPTVKLKTK